MRLTEDPIIIEGSHQRPTFLLVIPTLGMVPIEFVVTFARLQMPINCIAKSLIISKTEVGVARNYAGKVILDMDPVPEYLFFLGDDMLTPWDGLIKLWQEMETGKWDVLAGLYFIKQDLPVPIMWRDDIAGFLEPYKHFQPGEVIATDICGMDFTLIKSDVFKKLEYPWFETGPGKLPGDMYIPGQQEYTVFTEDVYFTRKCKLAGLKVGVHTDVRVGHISISTGEIY